MSARPVTAFGVDGCPAGWFVVALDDSGGWRVAVEEEIDGVWRRARGADAVLVDIPIGLRLGGERERRCDRAARQLLGRRGGSVFPAPCRPALAAADYEEAKEINRERTGRALTRQAWSILPKIRQVDGLLRSRPVARGRLRETHPEVLFWALNGQAAMEHSKKSTEGVAERREVLRRRWPAADEVVEAALERFLRREVGRDDILDAMAAAVSGVRAAGRLRTLPRLPERDMMGLPMEVVYCDR